MDTPVRPLELQDLGAPTFTNFSSRDGLPHAVMLEIRTDKDGFVWAASPNGVFRYDGRHWEASLDAGMDQSVASLWLDHSGTLWAAFRTAGLARYDGARWQVENSRTGLPSQQIRRFAETTDAHGNYTLWALTWDHGLMVLRDGHWRNDPDNASLPRGSLLAMAQTRQIDGHARQWVGTGTAGLWYRDEGVPGWRQWHAPGLDTAQVEYLMTTQRHGREELWISVFSVGLWRLSADGLQQWSKEAGELPTNELYDMATTPLPGDDQAIWISSRSGLLRVHDGQVQVFNRQHGLPSNVIRGLNAWRSPAGNDVLWLATEAGISRALPGASAWSTASLMGTDSTGVFSVLVEPDGRGGERLWVGSNEDGLGIYEDGRWRHFTAANSSLPASSAMLVGANSDRDGVREYWIGLRGGELVRARLDRHDSPDFEHITTPWPKSIGEAVMDTLVRTRDGHREQWFATRQSGVYRWRNGQWTAFRADGVIGQWRITQLQQQRDSQGRDWLWASTNQGLARFDGQRWTRFGNESGLVDPELMGLTLISDAQGRPILWAGSVSAGIERIDVSDPAHPQVLPATLPHAPDATAYSALADSTGRIYICTNNGVQQLTPLGDGYRSRVFSRRDGMIHDECNTNAQFIDAHDRFWTGTLGGLTVYDPHRKTIGTTPKPLRFVSMSVDGKPVAIGEPGNTKLDVGAGAKSIDIGFALLSWNQESESRFRSQLIGFDDVPGDWTATSTRTFSGLPPGTYHLRVEARDYNGNASKPIELSIHVAAPWWAQPWARVLAMLTLLLFGYAAFQWRVRALKLRQLRLERRVAARTVELDEANARLVELSYHDALTGLANRRRLLEQLEQLPEETDHTDCHALILIDVDLFKNYNDRFGHPAGDEALRAVATTMLGCAPEKALVARYGGEEFACLLTHADCAQAVALAEQMRAAVAACAIPVPGESVSMHVTISVGVACHPVLCIDDTHHLLRDADLALYEAKRDGRNRVRVRDTTSS